MHVDVINRMSVIESDDLHGALIRVVDEDAKQRNDESAYKFT